MEDYIKHVLLHNDYGEPRRAWCGAMIEPFEWVFDGPEHAALNGAQKGRLLTCPACALAIYKAMCQDEQ